MRVALQNSDRLVATAMPAELSGRGRKRFLQPNCTATIAQSSDLNTENAVLAECAGAMRGGNAGRGGSGASVWRRAGSVYDAPRQQMKGFLGRCTASRGRAGADYPESGWSEYVRTRGPRGKAKGQG